MHFFNSLSLAFHVWQFSCLSPFHLRLQQQHQHRSHSTNFYRNCSYIAIASALVIIILCCIFVNEIIFSSEYKQTVKVLDGMTMWLAQFTALVIFYESYSKRRMQRNFFYKINSIDFLMEYQIGIRPNYAKQKKTIRRQTMRWLILYAIVFITNLVIMYIAFENTTRWWVVFFGPYFICSLRYYQITTCVDMIHCRYQQLNHFIDHLRTTAAAAVAAADANDDGKVHEAQQISNFTKMPMNCAPVTMISSHHNNRNKSGSIYEKLHHLRRVCRLLSSSNHNINEAFQYSILLIIINDFLHILINSFWTIRILLRPNIRYFYMIPPLLWASVNFNHIISLSAACHHATEEVISHMCVN